MGHRAEGGRWKLLEPQRLRSLRRGCSVAGLQWWNAGQRQGAQEAESKEGVGPAWGM